MTRVRIATLAPLVASASVGACIAEDSDEAFESFAEEARLETESGDLYVVEGDLHFSSIDGLREWYETVIGGEIGPRSTVKLYQGEWDVWDPMTALDLRYCISTDFENDYWRMQEEMLEATRAWETVANVHFVYRPEWDEVCNETKPVTFAVRPGPGGGCATFPNDPDLYGCAYPQSLTMNLSAIDAGEHSSLGILKHELGHKLGLGHEWHNSGGCQSPTGYENLTEFDALSVMLYPGVCQTADVPYEISRLDGQGLRRIYGMPVAWYVGSGAI